MLGVVGCAEGDDEAMEATGKLRRLCGALDNRYSNVQTKVPATAICNSTVAAKSVGETFIHRVELGVELRVSPLF